MPLSLSVLKLSSSLKTLSSKLSQHHSLKLPHSPPSAWLILNVVATKARCHRPTSCPKLPIILRPTPPSALDPRRQSPQTHFSFVLSLSFSLSLSPFLAPIGSHITRLTSNQSILFRFALIITVYDHWSMIGAGLVGWYRIGQSIKHGFRFGCVDFSRFLLTSSSLVLIGTMGLWLCNGFYGFDGGCGGGWMKYYFIVMFILFYCVKK